MAAARAEDGGIARSDASGTLLGMITTFVTTPVGGKDPDEAATAGGESSSSSSSSTTASSAAPAAAKRVPVGETWWRELLTRLKHPEAAQIRTFLQSRLRQFLTQSIDDIPESGAGSMRDQVQKLQRETLVRMQRSGPWSELTEDGWAQTSEALERFVASQLHDHVIGARAADNVADERLSERCDALASFVTAEQLGVPAGALDPRLSAAWASAQDFLHRIGAFKDPWRKLLCIDRCCRQLYRVLHTAAARTRAADCAQADSNETRAVQSDVTSSAPTSSSPGTGGSDTDEGGAPTGDAGEAAAEPATAAATPSSVTIADDVSTPRGSADDLVPCVIWCLLRSNPGRLHSHLAFIDRFRPASRTKGSLGYHMTVMQSAMHFVERAEAAALGMTEESFSEHMAAGAAEAASRRAVAQRLQRLGDGHVDDSDDGVASTMGDGAAQAAAPASAAGAFPATPDLSLFAAAPTAPELPLTPALPAATVEALAAWRRQRYRFVERDPASLTMAEVPQLLEEYRNLVTTCASVAEALGLPPPDVALLRHTPGAVAEECE